MTASINDAAQLARREWCTERQVNLTLSLAFLALNSSRQRSKDVSINIERLCDADPELGPRSFESSVSFRAKHLPTRAQQIKIAELPQGSMLRFLDYGARMRLRRLQRPESCSLAMRRSSRAQWWVPFAPMRRYVETPHEPHLGMICEPIKCIS